ncbi:DUF6233 domain-containing protein [Streptomyces akebiae]|uniref:Uncharacterized protein n=1 Tax=Streptomyces akebiae TaxID=2865673 RepID=A0ABX8XWN6_9ACTN|nr:DUF6233 domain-containing protein [Streptomyces akebiae]QYX80244.1 hypothetical protein K1J60_30290 [Streptomyces akebiae]
MSALPPDTPRLRAILRYLDEQITDNETVGVYLRLQHDAVSKALARNEGPAAAQPAQTPQESPDALPAFAGGRRGLNATGFAVERQPRAIGPEPARIHTDDCRNAGPTHPITAHDARAALFDPMVQACGFCRPDTELGIDLD